MSWQTATSTSSIRVGTPRPQMSRTTSKSSARSRISRIASRFSSKSRKKGQLERPKLPENDLDNGIVGWEGQDDPENPLNFAPKKKWLILFLLASITFISPFASSIFAPAVSYMDAEFNNDSVLLSTLSVSVFVLGYVIGPLILAPLCEIYGRRPILTLANTIFCVWQIGCALAPNLNSLIAFRFLAGIGGAGCMTIGGGVIADLFHAEERGLATSLYSIGPLFGPIVGPIAGGFIGQQAGWRWVFWVLLIAGSVVTISIEILNRETNARVLIKKKMARLSKELSRTDLRSCYDTPGKVRLTSVKSKHNANKS